MLRPYHNIEQAIETLYLKGIKIPVPLAFSEIGRALSVITSQFLNSEKVNLRLFGYCSKLLRLLPFNENENTSIADLCERAWTFGDNHTIAKAVSLLWDLWYRSIDDAEIKFIKKEVKVKCVYDNWKAKYQHDEFSYILQFCKIIENDFNTFLLDAQIHGSLSDMDKTPYSDLDVLLVVKGEVIRDVSTLLDLKSEILKLLKVIRGLDSLQHHGLFILTEQEMSCYAESRFPLLLMDYATSLLEKPVLYFNTIEDKMQSASSLYNMAKRVMSIDKISSDNYNLKMYSSWIMLLPTLYYQLFNDYVYKAESFKLVRTHFDKYSWDAVEACSALRLNWDCEDANDLTLLGLEPDIIKKAKTFSQFIIDKVDSCSVNDSLWEKVDIALTSKDYAVDYHPVYYSLEEFTHIENQWVLRLSKIDGIHSIYSFGTNTPTCGISDLDLLIVLDDDLTDDIAFEIGKVRKEFQIGLSGYIKWHEEIIVEREDLELYINLWEPVPRFLGGKEDLLKELDVIKNRSGFRKILLFKEGLFQFFKMMEFFFMPSVPLRLVLLRCNSIRYDIAIAEEVLGVKHSLSKSFLKDIVILRNSWFSINHNERLKRCRGVLINALRISHSLLSESTIKVSLNEREDLFRGVDPEIDIGILKIKFQKTGFINDNPHNIDIANKIVTFPIELYPIIELSQQSIKSSHQFDLYDLSLQLDTDLREKILLFQSIWAKSIEIEEKIKKS